MIQINLNYKAKSLIKVISYAEHFVLVNNFISYLTTANYKSNIFYSIFQFNHLLYKNIIIMIDSTHLSNNITLRQQQTVQQIIAEVGSAQYQLDEQLKAMIESGQHLIQRQYQAQAEQRMVFNRQGINFQEIKQPFQLQDKQEQAVQYPVYEQNELNTYQRESINKSKFTQQEILELDSQFPKLTYNSMVGQQQNIFELQPTQAAKWLTHRKTSLIDLKDAIGCRVNDKIWIILAIKNELIIFMGAQTSEPFVMPHSANITAYAVSPCKKYLAVGMEAQIIVYEIRKGSNIVLLKNVNDLKVKKIKKLGFYEGNNPKLYFIDEISRVGLVSIEIGMILTKVKIDQIVHGLEQINSCQIIKYNKDILVALTGSQRLRLATIEPQMQFFQNIEVSNNSRCLWRKHKQKLQLLVSQDNRVVIYKLTHLSQEECYYLQQHLLFLNHYTIQNIFLISQFHILLQSDSNFTVVGLPLIPSVVQDPDLLQSEGAIVFVLLKESSNRVLRCMEECLLIYWKDSVQIGKLKYLQDYIDELIMQKSAFRQALSLLILVSKGINYSFKFSYQIQDLKKIIYGAVQMSASALLPSLDKKIVMFRVGWVAQLCIECREQQMLWNSFYPILKEKHLQNILFQMIRIFILKNQLTRIPQDIFLQIVNYYAQKDQQLIIEKLVLTNKEQFQATKLLSLLNQKQMNYLQFYLFSRGILSDQCDFYTPFLRSFTAFSRNMENQSPKKLQSALLCFLILSKTFSFQYIPNGYMTRDTKQIVVKQFFLQTLSKMFIKKLSDFNLRLYLQIYLLPFYNEEFKDILFDDQAGVVQKMKMYSIEEEAHVQPNFVVTFLDHFQNCIGFNRNSILFAQFYATVLYFTHSTAKFQRIVQILAILFQKKLYRYALRMLPDSRPTTKQLKQYLVKLIQKDLYQRLDRLYIKKLLVFEDREVGYMLHRVDKNYQASLQLYLGNHGTNGLFQFVRQIYQQAQNLPEDSNFQRTRKKLQIRNFLVRNIGLLFRTDSIVALQTLYMVGETTQKIHDLIFNAHFEKQQKLHFLTAVLTKWENQQFQHKQKYLLQHLEEVCQLSQRQMRSYLDRFFYPLDLAIKVADQKSNYLAKAILQTRSGLIEEAFSSYEKLIKNTLLVNKEEDQTRAKVNKYIQQCIQLCRLYSGQNFQENLWVRLMKFISSFVASQHQYKVYLKVELQRSNQAIITEMLHFLGTLLLIKFFTSPSIPLPFHKLIPIYDQLYRKVKFDKLTIQRSLLIFKRDLLSLRKSMSFQNKLAIKIENICDFCKGKLSDEQRNTIYSCGHSFHNICHDDPTICLTCSYESDETLILRAIFKKNDIKKINDAPKPKKKVEINTDIYVMTKAEASLQANRKRLKIFDYEQDQQNQRIYELANKTFGIDGIVFE